MKSTLLLNASYEPLRVLSVKDAMRLLFKNKAHVIEESPYTFDTTYKSYPVPYIIIMNYQVKVNHKAQERLYTRRGVLLRDNYECAYCGKHANTIDHVLPRSLGGVDSYENCVAACLSCNNKKSNLTLDQIGWKLRWVPKAPSTYNAVLRKIDVNDENYPHWEPYVGYLMQKKT